MTPLARRVARSIRQGSWLAPGERVAIAVSGGADSVALAWLLRELAGVSVCAVAGLIHVHHGLRGDDADADEAFCRDLARRLGLPIEIARVDVAARARERQCSVEVAARDLRYAVFDDAAIRLQASAVATGHTADDQAETVLLRLLRGAGTRGLAGIRARRGPYVRPLLECRRADLVAYLEAMDEPFRQDRTNADVSVPRNRIRHELLPVIERLAPGGVPALARCAALAAEDEAFLREALIDVSSDVVLSEEASAEGAPVERVVDVPRLVALAPALGRRLIRDLADQVSGASWSARHIEAVLRLARADKQEAHLDLPGAEVERRGAVLALRPVLTRGAAPVEIREAPWFERTLDVPGHVEVPEAGATVVATRLVSGGAISSGADIATVQADSVTWPFTVRNRRPGDRMRPLGAPGSRKLQDVFVDRKVPRRDRDRVPLVVDAAGRIIWVAGLAIAHECRVTAPEAGVVVLELRR